MSCVTCVGIILITSAEALIFETIVFFLLKVTYQAYAPSRNCCHVNHTSCCGACSGSTRSITRFPLIKVFTSIFSALSTSAQATGLAGMHSSYSCISTRELGQNAPATAATFALHRLGLAGSVRATL